MSQLLSRQEIESQVRQLSGWTLEDKKIRSICKFKDFIEAVDFVNKLVEPAEKLGHHPDIAISYNRVTIDLTTHDAGGLTEKDFVLAQQISRLL